MDLGFPSIGDGFKAVCDELGVDDKTSDFIVATGCLATGDYVGAAEYGSECLGHLRANLDSTQAPGTQVSRGYDLTTADGWYRYMHDDPDRAIQAYHEALRTNTLPDSLKNNPGFQMEMGTLFQERNRQIVALSTLEQSIHETLKQVCSFRV